MGNLFKWLLRVLIGCFGIGCLLAVAVLAGPETSGIIITPKPVTILGNSPKWRRYLMISL